MPSKGVHVQLCNIDGATKLDVNTLTYIKVNRQSKAEPTISYITGTERVGTV